MHPAEQLRVGLFVGIVVAVYVVAAATILRGVLRGRGAREAPFPRWFVWTRRVAVSLAGVGLACFAYGWRVEPYWPEITHVRIATAKIPPGTPPIRIAQLSDLHSDPKVRLERKLPGLVAAERPDLIVFTGDAINSKAGLSNFRRCLAELAQIAPTFAVRGNWDSWYSRAIDLFGGTGARELDGEAVPVDVRGTRLWLVGIAVPDEHRLEHALSVVPPGSLSVLLYHYPDLIREARDRVDLYCAAHTHGGQVALPFYGALVTFSRFGKKYESGLFRVGTTWMYVNRGIGMEGGPVPRVRFCARPEITIYEIGPR